MPHAQTSAAAMVLVVQTTNALAMKIGWAETAAKEDANMHDLGKMLQGEMMMPIFGRNAPIEDRAIAKLVNANVTITLLVVDVEE
jgi:hypothetical protein